MHIFSIREFFASNKPKNQRFYTIAIDGRGGSGKTTFSHYLENFLEDFAFLKGDDYFEPIENQIMWGEFNDQRFLNDVITPLQTTNTFIYRPYDWHTQPHITRQEITLEKGFCIERCFSFAMDVDWDLKIWVDTPREICLKRGLSRQEMPHERALAAWTTIWQPKEDAYILSHHPQKNADIIIDGTGSFEDQIN